MKFEQYWVPYPSGAGYIKYTEQSVKYDLARYLLRDTDGNGSMAFEFSSDRFPSTGLIYEIK